MKKKILVLDVLTNGHEAAIKFIQRQGWQKEECEFIFCGSHDNIFQKFKEGSAYAVVPINNSIAGPVAEVMKNLEIARKNNFNFQEVDRFDLPINHYLLAPEWIKDTQELEEVWSHEKALQQCRKFLDVLKISPDKRIKYPSTSRAAKAVADLNSGEKIGAIASKVATVESGLRILAKNIEDKPDNQTTFILLRSLL